MSDFADTKCTSLSQESDISLSSDNHQPSPDLAELTSKAPVAKKVTPPSTGKNTQKAISNFAKKSNSNSSVESKASHDPTPSTKKPAAPRKVVKVSKTVKPVEKRDQSKSPDYSSDSSFNLSENEKDMSDSDVDSDQSMEFSSDMSDSSSSSEEDEDNSDSDEDIDEDEDEFDSAYSSKRHKLSAVSRSDDERVSPKNFRKRNHVKRLSPASKMKSKSSSRHSKRRMKPEEEIVYKLTTHPQTKFKELGFEMKALGFSNCNSFLKRSKEIKDRVFFATWYRDYSPYHVDTLASADSMFKNSNAWSLFLHHLCAFALQWNQDNVEHTSANFLRNWANKSYDV